MSVEKENQANEVKESAEGVAATAASGAAAEMSAEVFSRSAASNSENAQVSRTDRGQSLDDQLNKEGSLKNLGDLAKNAGSLADKGTPKDVGQKGEGLKDLVDSNKRAEDLSKILQGDRIPPMDNIMRHWDRPTMKSDGSHDLRTGDRLVVKDGKETLVTPSGDIVTVNKDGSVKVEGEVKEVSVDQNGNQVYTMADGAKITIGKHGISSVERNHERATLMKPFALGPIIRKPIDVWGPMLNRDATTKGS
jgi:hypothetical protein